MEVHQRMSRRQNLSHTFNLLVWIIGFVLFGIGLWLRLNGSQMKQYVGDSAVSNVFLMLMWSGVFVAVIVLMGSYAVFRREGNVLLVYGVLVALVFLFMMATEFYQLGDHSHHSSHEEPDPTDDFYEHAERKGNSSVSDVADEEFDEPGESLKGFIIGVPKDVKECGVGGMLAATRDSEGRSFVVAVVVCSLLNVVNLAMIFILRMFACRHDYVQL